jgi:hypothetical protein
LKRTPNRHLIQGHGDRPADELPCNDEELWTFMDLVHGIPSPVDDDGAPLDGGWLYWRLKDGVTWEDIGKIFPPALD